MDNIQSTSEPEGGDDAVIVGALWWSGAVLLLLMVGAMCAYWYVQRPEPQIAPKETPLVRAEVRDASVGDIPRMNFTNITDISGVHFVHQNGANGEKLLPETMGSGCGFFDFDNDGDQDLLLVNSAHWPSPQPAPQPRPTMGLYRNDGKGSFTDVTVGSGLDLTCYGMGVAFGDYDNDGLVDVYITALGPNFLLRNLGNGKFKDVTAACNVAGGADTWSTSAAFFDYDNDGDLDLFVGNYIVWSRSLDLEKNFTLTGGGRGYGRPQQFQGVFPYLFQNDGGVFRDVSSLTGVQIRNPAPPHAPLPKTLGVVPVDLDGDSWVDIVLANDTVQNLVLRNHRGTFTDVGVESGVAFDSQGNARGAMGIDVARFRNNATLGIGIGNFSNEMTALYVSHQGELTFTDDAIATALGPPTRLFLTFGLFFFDCDLDGRLDFLQTNGHLEPDITKVQRSQSYAQPTQLFWNCGPRETMEFALVSGDKCGTDLVSPLVGRGAAYADIDGDGDLDVCITANGGKTRLLRNDQKLGHHWLRLKLVGKRCNRDAMGANVELHTGNTRQYRQVMAGRGYLSQMELPVTFGLGQQTKVDKIVIRWPDGLIQAVLNPPLDQLLVIEQSPGNDRASIVR